MPRNRSGYSTFSSGYFTVLEEATHREAETFGYLGDIGLLGKGSSGLFDDFNFDCHARPQNSFSKKATQPSSHPDKISAPTTKMLSKERGSMPFQQSDMSWS